MIKSMRCGILYLILPLLLALRAGAAVIVTYRGDAPNTFNYTNFPFFTDSNFDVNADGMSDYRFVSDSFVAGIKSFGNNRFISTLSLPPDRGGDATPVILGNIIGVDTTSLAGDWHSHTENGGGSGFGLNFGSNSMQFADGYIGVEFMAADGIHYGWIQYVGFSHPEKGLGFPVLGGFIDSWAWETQPGVLIVAGTIPEPTTTTFVVVSVLSLIQRRRKNEQSTTRRDTATATSRLVGNVTRSMNIYSRFNVRPR
jgi:hypothetical protein